MSDRTPSPNIRVTALAHAPHLPRPNRAVRAAGVAFLVLAVFALGHLLTRPALEWDTVRQYVFATPVLLGIKNTLIMTVYAMALALVVAVVIANMRLSANRILRVIAGGYVWFFRSIPLLVLLILWFNFAIVYPRISVGVPSGPTFWSTNTNSLITGFWAAVLAFGLQQAAYTSEVIRAAILAVPKGQREAASAIGMSKGQIFLRVVLPQAMRIAIPPIGNDTINLLKATSMAAFIAVPDLLYSVQIIYQRTYQVVPLLIVATIWYAVFVTLLTVVQHFLERWLGRDLRERGSSAPPSAEGSVLQNEGMHRGSN